MCIHRQIEEGVEKRQRWVVREEAAVETSRAGGDSAEKWPPAAFKRMPL